MVTKMEQKILNKIWDKLDSLEANMATKADLAALRADFNRHEENNEKMFKQMQIGTIQIKDQTDKIPRMENDIDNIKDNLNTVKELQIKLNNDFESAIPVMENRLQEHTYILSRHEIQLKKLTRK